MIANISARIFADFSQACALEQGRQMQRRLQRLIVANSLPFQAELMAIFSHATADHTARLEPNNFSNDLSRSQLKANG